MDFIFINQVFSTIPVQILYCRLYYNIAIGSWLYVILVRWNIYFRTKIADVVW